MATLIRQIGVADLGEVVLAKHGVDGFGQLSAAALVDAARINPDVAIAVLGRLLIGILDLGEAPVVEVSPK